MLNFIGKIIVILGIITTVYNPKPFIILQLAFRNSLGNLRTIFAQKCATGVEDLHCEYLYSLLFLLMILRQ